MTFQEEQPQAPHPARRAIASARSLVIKLGTAVLTGGTDQIDRGYLHDLAAHLTAARDEGRRVLVVSSGAIGAGIGVLGLPSRPDDVATLQAAAAAGQPRLMSIWRDALDARRTPAAQILISRSDLDSRERYLNIRNCAGALQRLGAIPIVNENDTVATEEISLGDNDVLAAKLAVAVQAEALVILTTGPGVLDGADQLVHEAPDAASLRTLVRPIKTSQGRGGMATKVEAVRLATQAGIAAAIAPGRPHHALAALLRGERVGTAVAGADARLRGRRLWIALSATPSGVLTVDEGAARALVERNASLLARGVVSVSGAFEPGDVVSIRDSSGRELARGLSNFSAEHARRVMGRPSSEFESVLGFRTHEELVHRDNLALS
ncbi:MAG: glutamate 5-kinase [Planctomycetota bacterium]|nr:glutamate 5-kinase [Planctomycetota bacterium]